MKSCYVTMQTKTTEQRVLLRLLVCLIVLICCKIDFQISFPVLNFKRLLEEKRLLLIIISDVICLNAAPVSMDFLAVWSESSNPCHIPM